MWFLVWFQFMNNDLNYHQLSQHADRGECMRAREAAKVLVTSPNIMVQCFEVISEQAG